MGIYDEQPDGNIKIFNDNHRRHSPMQTCLALL